MDGSIKSMLYTNKGSHLAPILINNQTLCLPLSARLFIVRYFYPVKPWLSLPEELGIWTGVEVVEIVADFEIEQVDEGQEGYFLAVPVAADHQDEYDEAESPHQAHFGYR